LNDILNFKIDILTNLPAIHTSLYIFILSIGISFLQQDLGCIKLFTGSKQGNILSRVIFPKIFLSLLIISIIDLFIHENNLFPEEFVIAITITFFLIAILYIISLNVKKINQIDDLRIEAENKIIDTNKNLEKRIIERTNYLIKQNDVLENFAYIVSHNLRAPVSNLRPLLQLYKKEIIQEKKDIYIDKIETSINNLNNTLNELLDVIAIRNDLKSETLDFESTLLKIIESFQGQIIESKAEITYDFSKVTEIEYPAIYLESIIQNLLSNSLKFKCPERIPVIHLESKKINNKIQLSISDNGLGIDLKENGSLLFGFHKTFHKHPEAKGLGLFLIKKQIEIMGGNITATSQVDKGTTFEIIF
jgi:signal transduction histidine kinase